MLHSLENSLLKGLQTCLEVRQHDNDDDDDEDDDADADIYLPGFDCL